MHSFQLIEHIELLNSNLKDKEIENFIIWLNILKESHLILQSLLLTRIELITEGLLNSEKINKNHSEIESCIRKIKKAITPKLFFRSFEKLENSYTIFITNLNPNNDLEDYIKYKFSNLETAYEDFFGSPNYVEASQLINSGMAFLIALETIDKTINAITYTLQETFENDDSLSSLSLLLDSDYTFKEFLIKLEAIQSLYSEISFLFNISEIDFPLRIVKLESGSLWVKIFGESKVIDFLISLLKDGKDYTYRNVTTEGKIESSKQNFKVVEALLEHRTKMLESGLNVDELDARIQKSSVIIADNLINLLENESRIKINGELIKSTDKTEKLLKDSNKYLLEASKDNTDLTTGL